MYKINKLVLCFILITQFCFGIAQGANGFTPPTQKLLALFPINEIEKSLSIRKVVIPNKRAIEMIASAERAGILGYHGNSLDFMIYQDIIRHVMEIILEIPIRKDFHFLAVPLDPSLNIQTKELLGSVFMYSQQPERALYDTTFPLNFTLWDNANRLGLNTLENYAKNESVKPLGYRKRLEWLFKKLDIDLDKIDNLFDAAHKYLDSHTGIILQIFDNSDYSFAKKIAYPSYPNGHISENKTVDEYFLNDYYVPPFPHEVRLLLNNKETLNPKNPLKIVRHIPGISQVSLQNYETSMINRIKKFDFNKTSKSKYENELKTAWGL